MASDQDSEQDGRQGLDADDAVSEKESRAGESDSAGDEDRTGTNPAPTIHEEVSGGPSYSDDGEVWGWEGQEDWKNSSPADFFQDLGYGPAPGSRQSLREAIWQLPEQYRFVIAHPTSSVFIAEKGKADWNIVWIQLLGTAVIAGVLGLLSMVIPFASPGNVPGTGTGIQSPDLVRGLNLSTTVGLIVFIPVTFFIGSGILRLLARRFGGDGPFLEQCYTTLLFMVPFGIAISVIRLLPFIGGFFFWFGGLAALVYGVVLQILATMAVHHLTSDKATPPVIITAIILIPIMILLFAFLTFIFALINPIL